MNNVVPFFEKNDIYRNVHEVERRGVMWWKFGVHGYRDLGSVWKQGCSY
jgi:hypothetical protein